VFSSPLQGFALQNSSSHVMPTWTGAAAGIYGYTTKAFNQQVKNNIEKFDADFRFQLTKEEYLQILKSKILTSKSGVNTQLSDNYETNEFLRSKNLTIELTANGSVSTENTNETNLKSKFLTSSWGSNRKLPYVFTEQGVYMLMTVYHDRYIVVDYGRKTEKIYHCGASSKDAGKKVTTITKVTDRQVYHPLVDALLLNPVLSLN
jgi:hypothetical protein